MFLAPTVLAPGAVSVAPIFEGFWLSLHDTMLSTQDNDFVGLANYRRLGGDGQFWNAWRHTLLFTGASTLAETLIGLVMALVLYLPRPRIRPRGHARPLGDPDGRRRHAR